MGGAQSVTQEIPPTSTAEDVVCASETDISITFRNYGNQPLTSLDLTYDINGGTPATYNWTGNLASGAQETVTITNVSFEGLTSGATKEC